MYIEKAALFLSSPVPPHRQETLPETVEVAIAVGRVDHRLGDVVAGLHPRVGERPAELVLGKALAISFSHFR